ncbi:hypothetical protein RZS28_17730 [Methylocapsa polymorpha]|uniref:DUF2946 domain-containing protein n=1 Tax=Methylocapsa polymorpha TaxID=3080828 RepID=A0ABZ0HS40_9HYPH|nr:hypothetical protein RZS28_17730 [Methylocapsa sp. RX1]
MTSLRQGSATKRVAISVVALYALLLQALLGAAAHAAAFDRFGNAICAPDGSNPEAPGGEQDHQHCLCCILACAASGCAYLATASGLAAFPQRMALAVVWAPMPGIPTRAPQRFYFAARGPPESI